ncbi:YqkE family protein [Sporosarcina pasteurii]|uniref:DUF3886 domain-containing protein n=1 Tax=Sporosarcina pasteurii TaxID=1474 RepID=A0A380BI58_SPOPA|nr:YqkE family protein [Sporosarcina pasteurii]MDS9470675.1 YqkE family protein [Sporosarcina pasteurii]QBQ05639.1 DUF3886 domain-containing protein [Sporosarcina pasteurii]SUJ01452.1 Uncharacterised protein [Sporosarcina pasteurii]
MRKNKHHQRKSNQDSSLSISDALNEDVLSKLKEAKKELAQVEKKKEEQRQEQIRLERKEREKNKTFEELLNEYGDIGSKF